MPAAMSRPADVDITRGELEAWAVEHFPEDFALFKKEVDKIMTPTSYPHGYDPSFPAGPKPEYRDWVLPAPSDRQELNFDKHLYLMVGSAKKTEIGQIKADKIFVYVTPANNLHFGRDFQYGVNLSHLERLTDEQIATDENIILFPFWRAMLRKDFPHMSASLIKAAALYLHMMRELVPRFNGRWAVKENFQEACIAWAEQCHPGRSRVAQAKRPMENIGEEKGVPKRVKVQYAKVKELNEAKHASTQEMLRLVEANRQLLAENADLRWEATQLRDAAVKHKRKEKAIRDLLQEED